MVLETLEIAERVSIREVKSNVLTLPSFLKKKLVTI